MYKVLYISSGRNFLKELQNEGGYDIYQDEKKRLGKLFKMHMVLLFVSLLICLFRFGIYFWFFILGNFLNFCYFRIKFEEAVDVFIQYCKMINKFEDYVKVYLKLPDRDITNELEEINSLYGKKFQHNEIKEKSTFQTFLILKKKSFEYYMNEYERNFLNQVILIKLVLHFILFQIISIYLML